MSSSIEPYLAIAIILGCFLSLVISKKEPEIIFAVGLLLMVFTGIIPIETALTGFSSNGLITVACLFIVAAAIKEVGLIQPLIVKLMKATSQPIFVLAKLLLPVSFLSAFLNNTPIVAALIPAVRNWCRNQQNKTLWNKKYFLLPLSYAAVLGGTCTLIGTSTNVLIFGFLINDGFQDQLSFFSIAIVGLPITLAGLGYLLLFSRKSIQVPFNADDPIADSRQYTVEMLVENNSPISGLSVEKAGLRHLQGVYLVEIIRKQMILPVVGSNELLEAGDRLIFSGEVNAISDLIAIKGLVPAEDTVFKLHTNNSQVNLVEAIISSHHPLVEKTIKDVGFRRRYKASVLAVVREGKRVKGKVGDIQLKLGDTLLLLAKKSFIEKHRYSKVLLLVSRGKEVNVAEPTKLKWVSFISLLFVALAASGVIQIVSAAILASLLMVVTQSLSLDKAKKSLDLQVLFIIGAAFGLGAGLNDSGGAAMIANNILELTGDHPLALLVATYLMTMILTELITNNAAAVIAYSLVSGIVSTLEYNMLPFAITIMIAASASFISPLGYQTNLMVFSAGRYQFKDYFKLGVPLSLISALLTLLIVPNVWSLQ